MILTLPVEICDPFLRQFPMGYTTDGAAGIDLRAASMSHDQAEQGPDWLIHPRGTAIIPCGVKVAIPPGHEGNLRLRSGHGFKQHLDCHNGTIDADYRGELCVKLYNHSPGDVRISPGERFAQLVIHPILRPRVVLIADVAGAYPTERGAGAYGSTGKE